MKVALCLSGQPRQALETYSYIFKNIIEPNNADVFIHMHYDKNNLFMEKSHADSGNCILEKDIDKKIIELYKPIRYLIEAPRNFKKSNLKLDEKRLLRSKNMNSHKNWSDKENTEYTIKQVMSMYYSIYKCNELKELYSNETDIIYDYVIRIRFDLKIMTPIICINLNPNILYYIEIGQPDEMISDWLNIGSNAIMNIYASQYLNIEYMNTFQYYSLENRISTEPSSKCGGLSEHLLRDLIHLYKIPKQGIYINCELVY
jgi:hypothetical protein